MYATTRKAMGAFLRPLSSAELPCLSSKAATHSISCAAVLVRAAIIESLSPGRITFAEVLCSRCLAVNGGQFVSPPSCIPDALSSSWNATPVTCC